MVDPNNQRPHRAYDPHEQVRGSGGAQPDAGNNPLAELARLIGQSDPFVDFERKTGAETQRAHQAAPPPPQEWPAEAAHQPQSSPHTEAYPSVATAAPYAAVGAAAAPQDGVSQGYPEQYPEGTYTPYPEEADPTQAGYGYPPEAYPEGYDPYYADGEGLDEAEFLAQQAQQRRSRRRLAAVVAILSLAVFGGAAAYGYRTFVESEASASPPPVIKADTTPTKVKPAVKARDSASNKLIYDRVGERSQAAERVVPREEQPVDIKTAAVAQGPRAGYPATAPSAIPVAGRSTSGQVLPVASAPSIGQASGAILPSAKKVRTVTIRPDMTVVPRTAAPPPQAARAPEPPPPPEPTQATPQSVASVPAAPAPTTRNAPPPRRSSSAPLSLSPDAAPPAAPAPRAPARSAQQPLALASVPAAGSNGAGTATARSSGNFAVQVSSQRSEAEANASYRTLQSRYPNVLGGRSSFVRRADLGSRGVYYRTMVGPFATGEQAAKLCSSLKAAGGQCIIHRN